jgi:hypothetical protein
MNCYNHPTQTAVAQCSDCGKGLCSNCATTYSIPICNLCNKSRIQGEKSRIIKEILLTIVFGVGIAYLFGQKFFFDGHSFSLKSTIWYYIIYIYIFAGVVAGWKTLTAITPRMFLVLPIIGWVLYFALKLFLSFWVGLIMLPVRMIRNIYRLTRLQKITV